MGSLTRRPLLTVSVTAVTCAALMTGRGAALAGGSPAGAPGAAPSVAFSGGIWGNAEQVPGTASLNVGGEAAIFSVSCASAGNCGGGGVYKDASLRRHAFVVNQRNGKWGKAVEVKSTNLNASSFSEIFSVSCPAAGNCSAGGRYEAGSSGRYQAFVVSQRNGTWGTAIEVPGTATLNAGANATVSSLSCSSAGNCAAGGQYMGKSGRFQPFVVSQRDGKWGKALRVPGTSVLNAGG